MEKNTNKKISFYSTYILLLLILSLIVIFFVSLSLTLNKYSDKTKLSALVNPKYLSDIKLIQITDDINNQEILLQKNTDNKWYLINKNLQENILADSEYIDNLLKNFTNVLNMYEYSDKKQVKCKFSTNNSILFYTSSDIFDNKIKNSQLVSFLSFGYDDITGSLVSVFNNKNSYFYLQKDVLDYVNLNLQKFIIKDFFPIKDIYNNPIHQAIIKTPNSNLTLLVTNDSNFNSKIEKLILLRSNDIDLSLTTNKPDLSKNFQLSITLVSGNLLTYQLELYKVNNQNIVKANNIYYKISQWTADTINEIFN